MQSAVTLVGIAKSYGNLKVLGDINLIVRDGSFTSLLGPSGCGKTTLLNIIGGLDRPTGGEVHLGPDLVYSERQQVSLPTERRNIGFVFQSYALWPHLTVLENVSYPLKIRRLGRSERERRAREMLEKLELGVLADRYPFQLSGGQQQRVAIARSIVYRPRILLLDEPLSNLDAQLRERARAWLKNIHETFGLTTILVTHDQTEALSLSDQVVLLSQGRIEQVGTASEIYDRPETAYAAEFVGGANIIRGRAADAGSAMVTEAGIRISVRQKNPLLAGGAMCVAIRPQKIKLIDDIADNFVHGAVLPFAVTTVLYHGSVYEILGRTQVGELRVLTDRAPEATNTNILLPTEDCISVKP
ncbi:iron(III) transport system ATP-binding protein [Phyllobacterium trifolii]|uniref:Iron(III) transport system ATP-binding protein n=1 Tax=Phyllobacterium trifolii TaxID=300193 RepID=A0A839UDW4_9HYPH|nr:ABC transporter ATP-binding protein [Phyllobacterium trifolii]MBB3146891.1 iron(III) transport system ATP-binding protein [Phyllobacterium trifolii]